MPDSGIIILFKGVNFQRLMGGLGVTLELSLISVALSVAPPEGEVCVEITRCSVSR